MNLGGLPRFTRTAWNSRPARWFVWEEMGVLRSAAHGLHGCADRWRDGNGGWYYADFNNRNGHMSDSSPPWAYIGLESAEIAGGPFGVIVNNRHKYESQIIW